MDDDRVSKVDYIERTLDFYFEDGFREVVVEHDLSNEVDDWYQLAKLFSTSVLDPSQYSLVEKREAFDLVEDIWTEVKAAQYVGDQPDFSEIGEGYEIDLHKYEDVIERAKEAVCP